MTENNNNDTGNKETGNNDTGNNDTGNNDTSNNDTSNNDTGNNDTGNNDTGNNDTGNNDTGNKENTPASLLDVEDDGGGGVAPPPEMEEDALGEYVKGMLPDGELKIGKDGWGNEVLIGEAEAKAMAPYLAEAGLDSRQSAGVMRAVGALQKAAMDVAAERQLKNVRELARKSEEVFGDQLPAVVREASTGGRRIFGEMWDELKVIPEFCNDPRVLRALAAEGRKVKRETGSIGSEATQAEASFLNRMTGMKFD